MLSTRSASLFILAVFAAAGLSACDFSEQNYDIEPGNSLAIAGPSSAVVPNFDTSAAGEYFVRAFTVDKDYTWSLGGGSGAEIAEVRRNGEFVDLSFSEPGTYTLSVTAIGGGDPEYSGSITVTADYPDYLDQAAAQGYSAFVAAVERLSVDSLFQNIDEDAGEPSLTIFAPTNEAFAAALDTSGNGMVEAEEFPADSVLTRILQYHIVPDSLGQAEITDGLTAPTILESGAELSFDVSGGTVTINGEAEIVNFDNAVFRGVLHGIDEVLMPPSEDDSDGDDSDDGDDG